MIFDLQDVEEKLHYAFRDKELIYRAFTHASYSNEIQQRSGEKPKNNEVLEFLGDSILNFVVAEELFRLLPDADQGELTQKRAEIVSKPPCAEAMERMGLHQHIIFGVGAEAERDRNHRANGDLLEAILAAVYLDGGMAPARAFVQRALGEKIRAVAQPEPPKKSEPESRPAPEHPGYRGFPMYLGKAEHREEPREEGEELIFTEQPQPYVLEPVKKKKSRARKDDPVTSFSAAQKRERPTFGIEFRGSQPERKPEQVAALDPRPKDRNDKNRPESRNEAGNRQEKGKNRSENRGKPGQSDDRNRPESRNETGNWQEKGKNRSENRGKPGQSDNKNRPESRNETGNRPEKGKNRPENRGKPGQSDDKNRPESRNETGNRRKRGEASPAEQPAGTPSGEPAGEDYKSRLQEYCQKHYRQNPVYETLSQSGPSHEPEFSVKVSFSGVMLAQARGKSKRMAEQTAARDALELLSLPSSDKKGRKSSKERKH